MPFSFREINQITCEITSARDLTCDRANGCRGAEGDAVHGDRAGASGAESAVQRQGEGGQRPSPHDRGERQRQGAAARGPCPQGHEAPGRKGGPSPAEPVPAFHQSVG